MLKLIRENRFFIVPYIAALSVSTFFILSFTKSEIHIFLNQYHHPFADFFFKYLTDVGDGIVVALFLVLLLFIRYRYFLIMAASVFLTTSLVQGLKRIAFPHAFRPFNYFSETYQLYFVPGVELHHSNTFPSGHSASAFLVFFMAALIVKNDALKLLFFIIALLIAFSRVYLSQHFLVDIYTGSIISTVFTIIMFYFGMKWQKKGIDNQIILKKKNRV